MPRISMVKSLVPNEMPSIPSSTNLSINNTVAGTATVSQQRVGSDVPCFVFIFFAAWKSEKLVGLEVEASVDDGPWSKGCCHFSDSFGESIDHLLAASLFYEQSGMFPDGEHHVLCSQKTYAVRVGFSFY